MKLFTGWVMSAGVALAATSAKAQMPAPAPGVTRRFPMSTGPTRRCRRRRRPRYGYGPTLLPPTEVYTVRPRERVFAARHSAAARLFLHHRRDRSRRRRRQAHHRRAQRADHPLHAGRPDGRQFQRRFERRVWRAGTAAADDQCPGRAASAAIDPACCQPHACRYRSRARSSPPGRAEPAQQAAAVQPKPAETQAAAPPPRPPPSPGQAAGTVDPADPGNARRAGPGVKSSVAKHVMAGTSPAMVGACRGLFLAAGGGQDQVGDFAGMRDQRQMAGVEFHGGGVHAFGQKPLEVGVDGLIELRDRVP